MKYSFIIAKKLPSFNEYTNANRYNRYKGAKMKKDLQSFIRGAIYCQLGKIKIEKPVIGNFTWIEENRRRDLDNVCYAKKFILDSLVECGVLKDDNRKMVCGFRDSFEYGKTAKVIVELEEIEEEDK